jgi:N-alpha-acetyltransferase 40
MAKRKADELTGTTSLTDGNHGATKKTKKSSPTKKWDKHTVKKLNALEYDAFKTQFIQPEWLQHTPVPTSIVAAQQHVSFKADFKFASDLSSAELSTCFNLIATTSRSDYEAAGWGWHPKRKLKEMRDKDMRYFLLHATSEADSNEPQPSGFAGFLSFMLTHDSTPSVPVLYIYEIHLVESARGTGLGAHLMTVAESIARATGMEKVMLTCILINDKARRFYERHGFGTDACSPEDKATRKKAIKVEYVIMSKEVESIGAQETELARLPLEGVDSGG